MARAVGIDLGTTKTVVATLERGRPLVIPNAEGHHLTPSVVGFTGSREPLVGQPAKDQAVANPDGTVFSIKRRMGSNYKVRVGTRGYTPQEVSSLILRKVKADAESYLGEGIDRAVITVPAYFNDLQRQATREAGILAGLEVIRIINEPTATALAYGLDREDAQLILVWDLGGGTFDVSILELGEGIFEVKAVNGDTWLGGDDFDSRLTDFLVGQHSRAAGPGVAVDGGTRQSLRALAERAKMELTLSLTTRIPIPLPGRSQDGHLVVELTRQQLEDMTRDLVQRMVAPISQVLADACITPADIERVILVGGATRMPAVRALAKGLLEREPYRYIDPDEVVAMGAAIQAGMLLGQVDRAVLLDVLPLSLGVETQHGLMSTIIPRNTPVPASGSRIYTTAADHQTSMDIHVLQGERAMAVDNISLRQLQLRDIPSASRGVAKVEVAFEVDVDGIVHVTARDLLSEQELSVQLASTKQLDREEIGQHVDEAVARAEEDRRRREEVRTLIEAENLLAAAEAVLEERGAAGRSDAVKSLEKAVASTREELCRGASDDLRLCCGELGKLLAAAAQRPERA